ncbi:DUF6973 domain-containing protein [Polaribacter gochangensis]|uniref:DUF6973 domain-containing protein n=1 Tax=Polaribacter gochangensis TaxID=3252903 RepID=UPI003904D18B
MKKIKHVLALAMILTVTMLLSNCQNTDFEEIVQEEQLLGKKKPDKFIYYRGLKVKKRFKASEKELKVKKDKKSLKALYNRLRKEARKGVKTQSKKSKISYEIDDGPLEDVELPTPEMLVEAAKAVINQFPYEEIEGYATTFNPNPNSTNHEMIQGDFVGLSNAEIEANENIIDDYYSDNLDYMTLNEIATNPQLYNHLGTNKSKFGKSNDEASIALCTLNRAFFLGYGLVRPSISYGFATPTSYYDAGNKYPNLDEGNTRRDAYRHMLWNALLAHYYFTISSKSKRLGFATLVTNLRESSPCGNANAIDSRAMDYHNNAIGRKVWDDGTEYLKIFGFTVGLMQSSTSQYKMRIFNMIERESCYIVKTEAEGILNDYDDNEVKVEILNTNINTPVYFIGPIAPVSYVGSIELEYYECDDNDGDFIPKRGEKSTNASGIVPDENGDCFREIMVYTPVYPCYVSKDVNFNPY